MVGINKFLKISHMRAHRSNVKAKGRLAGGDVKEED
jgi:hypothetical protein